MIAHWVKNILSTLVPVESISQGTQVFEKKVKERLSQLTDVEEKAVSSEEARKKGQALMAAMSHSGSRINRLKMWLGVRRKVRKGLLEAYEEVPGAADEVTEKILEAAQYDPYIRKLFR